VTNFDEMNLPPALLRGVYGFGFETPSVIQQRAIVPLGKGYDIIAQSQSGTGKTGAFSIGLLQRIDPSVRRVQAMVLEPTRELANQSAEVIRHIGTHLDISVHAAVGGTDVHKDATILKNGVHVLAGTPGRIKDLMRRGRLILDDLKVLILDEADEMLSEGFLDAMRDIFSELPNSTQVGLFSATLPPDVLAITDKFMKDPVRIVLTKETLTLQGIKQFHVYVQRDEYKLDTLLDLYERLSMSQSVIFVNTRKRVDWLAKELDSRDFTVSCIHSDLHPAERTAVMEQFRIGRSRILIATDLVARGIDVGGVGFVVNYDLTRNFENYIHRIGRSGRFGRKGLAINFVVEREQGLLKDLQAFYNTEIPELTQDFNLS
jgi:translation initiation factor 4A